jgi:DNA polymerase-4
MKLHMDLDCYFVSAERTRYPFLKNRPVVVVKSSDKRIFNNTKKSGSLLDDSGAFNGLLEFSNHYNSKNILSVWRDLFIDSKGVIRGIVIAKSYEAKKYGIKTGTPLKEALLLCPNLCIIPSDHLFYQKLSFKLKKFLQTQIPLLEQYSIDEFFGDLDGWVEPKEVFNFIKQLQQKILKQFDLPISIAASSSKWIAKLATNTIKPFGVKVVYPWQIQSFTDPIFIEDFPGIGKAITKRLKAHNVHTLKEAKSLPWLFYSYGKTGKELYKKILGQDNDPVLPSKERKGIGISRNFSPVYDRGELRRRVRILSRYLSYTIAKLNLFPTTFYMKLRYEHGQKNSRSVTSEHYCNEAFLRSIFLELFEDLDIYPRYKIHYIGLSARNFATKNNPKTFSLLTHKYDTKMHHLTKTLTKIRDKHGIDMINIGSELAALGM